MRGAMLVWFVLCLACCSHPLEELGDNVAKGVVRSFSRVNAWVRYEHQGIGYVHLWSADHPKRVLIVREDEADPRLLRLLREYVPMQGVLTVIAEVPEDSEQGVIYLRDVTVAQPEQDAGRESAA